MTTVAWDGNTLAADKQSTYLIPIQANKIQAIKYNGENAFAAGAGVIRDIYPFIEALKKGKKLPSIDQEEPTFDVLVVTKSRKAYLYNGSDYPHELGNTKYAIGTGASFALGAMYAGKSAKEAVEIASQLDTGTGLGVDVVTFDKGKK